MKQPDPIPASCESLLPACLLARLAGLSQQVTRQIWQNVLLLVAGAILAPGKRTITATLRILGRQQETDFPIYHGVLNRAVCSSRTVAGWLLRLLVASFVSADATVVIGIDNTIERRWGHKISARGIYRDPVRSSKGHFVKTSGPPPVPIHWLLVRDPRSELAPQAVRCTDLDAAPVDILQWFVSRWQLEVSFQESRAHLGVETQRQRSDLAIMRTTPALLGLLSLVTLGARPGRRTAALSRNRGLVPQAARHLQRCHGGGPPPDRAAADLSHIPAAPGGYRNSTPAPGTRRECPRLCSVVR